MGGKYKCPYSSELCKARRNHSLPIQALQSLGSSHGIVGADNAEDLSTPELHFSLNEIYPPQVEIVKDEDNAISSNTTLLGSTIMDADHEATTAASSSWITAQDRNFNDEKYLSYVPIVRPWEWRFFNQQGTRSAYDGQAGTPLAAWERQALIEEPFSNIGEVAIKPAQGQQDELSHKAGKFQYEARNKRPRLLR